MKREGLLLLNNSWEGGRPDVVWRGGKELFWPGEIIYRGSRGGKGGELSAQICKKGVGLRLPEEGSMIGRV